jgi:hypothetical protein
MSFALVKRAAGNFLKSRGYLISKPTEIEKRYMRSPWAYLITHDPSRFAVTYSKNRKLLASVPQWISQETLNSSLWRYGVPAEWDLARNGDMYSSGLPDEDPEITSADILAFIASYLPDLRYLEIGVSVGKTFLQICDQFPSADIVGLDVEDVNPVLLSRFTRPKITWKADAPYEVDTLSGQPVKKLATMTELSSNVHYLSADQFRDETWQKLSGRRFNLVFSDGIHSSAALRTELQFLLKNDLIDRERFAMFWDDLWGDDMQSAFLDNAKGLCSLFGCDDDAISLFKMHGSYGYERPMGLFFSFLNKSLGSN